MPLFDAVGYVQQFVDVFVSVYALALLVYILLSWFRVPGALGPVYRFLHDICDPYLRLWRRVLPVAFGAIDFSPIVALFALYAARAIIHFLLSKLH